MSINLRKIYRYYNKYLHLCYTMHLSDTSLNSLEKKVLKTVLCRYPLGSGCSIETISKSFHDEYIKVISDTAYKQRWQEAMRSDVDEISEVLVNEGIPVIFPRLPKEEYPKIQNIIKRYFSQIMVEHIEDYFLLMHRMTDRPCLDELGLGKYGAFLDEGLAAREMIDTCEHLRLNYG